MINKQLSSTIEQFEMWDIYSPLEKKLRLINANDIPFIRWPNRTPCYEANLYMLSGLRRSFSRKVKGGTLKTYAMNISHLIRFCFKNNLKFTALTDDWFCLFIKSLQGERKLNGKLARKVNQIIKVGRQCLDFLIFVKGIYNLKTFIGCEKFNAIRVIEKEHKVCTEGQKKPLVKFYYTHKCLPKPDPVNKRHPISDKAAAALKEVIHNQQDRGLAKRNSAIYQTYEQTGCRRTEGMWLTVTDIKNALDSSEECPLLRLTTLKRRSDNVERSIPVNRVYLENVYNYIRTTRRKIIKKTIGKKKDHGIVFVSHTTGLPLSPDTISTYMGKWRTQAGISEQAFAHLLRHAYITEKLKCLIIEHGLQNKDEFRKAFISIERFKQQLREWTGHVRLSSLETYIDLAFADLAGVKQSYDAVTLKASVDLIQEKLKTIESDIQSGRSIMELTEELGRTVNAFSRDIEQCLKP